MTDADFKAFFADVEAMIKADEAPPSERDIAMLQELDAIGRPTCDLEISPQPQFQPKIVSMADTVLISTQN